jgi:SAM-dependent methyltransferase
MTAHHTLRGFVSRAGRGLRRLTGRRVDIDYRRWYSTWDLQRDYWTIVGPSTKEEYDQLGAVKLKLLLDLGLAPDMKILDVGCGTGQLTAALHEYLNDRGLYCGTDISPDAVAFCRSRFRRHNFSFRTSGMTVLPVYNVSFHVIAFFSVFTHTYPNETALLLREARRLLRGDGVIFADLFAAPLVERSSGDRAAVEVNPDYLFGLLDGSGLRAELVLTYPSPRLGQRQFYRFTRTPDDAGDNGVSVR